MHLAEDTPLFGAWDGGKDRAWFNQPDLPGNRAPFERLAVAGRLRHGGHPVLGWNVNNLAITQDPAGNIKPDKQRSREKIDGAVAAIMAIGRASVQIDGGDENPYAEGGFFVL